MRHVANRTIPRRLVAAMGVLFMTSVFAAPLPAQPTGQANDLERAACRQDVRRFCQAELQRNPDDALSITGCLRANRTKISRACRNTLLTHGQ
jgi:hypothetical protein